MKIGTGTTDATDDDVATKDLTGEDKGPGSTDVVPVDTGTYYFWEFSPGANYTTTFACEGTDAGPTSVGGSDYVYSLAVAKGENAVCTFTNTRDQGSVQLVKSWGTGTVGETILKIGTGTTDATDDDVATKDLTGEDKGPGSTDVVPVDTGTYYFSEVSPGANYTTTFACEGTDADPTSVGGSDYVYSLAVAKGENAVCTFTNTRDQGSVQLVKSWGTGTVGETILKIGTGTTDATDDDVATKDLTGEDKGPGSTDVVPVDTGTYYFSEVSPGANYTTTFACEGTDADPTRSAAGTRSTAWPLPRVRTPSAPSPTPATRARSRSSRTSSVRRPVPRST